MGQRLQSQSDGAAASSQAALFDAVYPADSARLSQIRRDVATVARGCGADERTVAKIKLAVNEAAANAILHAYRDSRAPGDVHVFVEQEQELLTVGVRDAGIGMAPRLDSPGAGLGLGLVTSLADRSEINIVSTGGTEIILGFRLAPQDDR